MKTINYLFQTVLICYMGISKLEAQDIHFSQFAMAPLLQNPALSGANYDLQAIINYKDQWGSVTSPYKTVSASFDMKLNKNKAKKGFLAGGVNIFSDKAGDANMKNTQENLNLAYHLFLNDKSTLGVGLMGGLAQRSINYSDLKWMSQYDGTSYNASLPTGEPVGDTKSTFADLGAGLVWTYKKGEAYLSGNDQVNANAGLAVFHPNQPQYSFNNSNEKLNTKIVAHANVLYGIKNSRLSLVPGFVFYSQGSAKELLIGSLFRYTLKESSRYTGYVKGSAFSIGLHYRNNDALIVSSLLEMGPYTLGISYDVNISGLKTASTGRGGLEISLRFINPNPFLYKSKARIN
jgi:type IX secretion system PorP/SprF family membrane protein